MQGIGFPSLLIPTVEHKRDFHTEAAFGSTSLAMNVQKPPLDNVLVRYALNMATDKQALCDFLRGGRVPARTIIPPVSGYPKRASLPVRIDGREYDVLSYSVAGARDLLSKAGVRSLEITYHFPLLQETTQSAEMLQQQWLQNLGIRLKLVPREFNAHWTMVLAREYSGIADYAFLPLYFDPNPFLDPFVTAGDANPTGWTDDDYRAMLDEANRTLNHDERMGKLAVCERRLLEAMPFIPMYLESWAYLLKPFVRGLASNLFDTRAFKYAWIDTGWRAG
jgi:oligopeptide transport system substrate-binding protein